MIIQLRTQTMNLKVYETFADDRLFFGDLIRVFELVINCSSQLFETSLVVMPLLRAGFCNRSGL